MLVVVLLVLFDSASSVSGVSSVSSCSSNSRANMISSSISRAISSVCSGSGISSASVI